MRVSWRVGDDVVDVEDVVDQYSDLGPYLDPSSITHRHGLCAFIWRLSGDSPWDTDRFPSTKPGMVHDMPANRIAMSDAEVSLHNPPPQDMSRLRCLSWVSLYGVSLSLLTTRIKVVEWMAQHGWLAAAREPCHWQAVVGMNCWFSASSLLGR